jgi:hypothetical protein
MDELAFFKRTSRKARIDSVVNAARMDSAAAAAVSPTVFKKFFRFQRQLLLSM